MAPTTAGDGYTTRGLPAPPPMSMTTIAMAGLLVDVYGLDELPSRNPAAPVTCLWLLHPRTFTRARMNDIASRTITAWNASPHSKAGSAEGRGMIALAFDMPNHGTRAVSERANGTWTQGNATHALDMMGMIKGGRTDLSGLMDVAGGYLGLENIEGHAVLGWSLGGHAAWEAWLGESRARTVVSVVGCPDYQSMMSERAQESNLQLGESQRFLGSKYFPPDLLATCAAYDPKGFFFADQPLPEGPQDMTDRERARLAALVDSRGLRRKKLMLLSGGNDKLVPYKHTAPFVKVLENMGHLQIDNRVYDGVGHWFTASMVEAAVEFLVKNVGEGHAPRARI